MIKILRLLVPIDFTQESQFALEWAVMVAQKTHGATIYLLHVFPVTNSTANLGFGSIGSQIEKEEVEKKMKEWQTQIPTDVLSFPLYEGGEVAEQVAKVCEEKNIDLVLMTTRGRRGLKFILPGSTTEQAVRLAPCPVLVLHLNDRTRENMPTADVSKTETRHE